MTVTVPRPSRSLSLPPSFTVCVSSNPEERGRVAAALDGQALLVIVADAQTALDVLSRAARTELPATEEHVVRLGRLEIDRRCATVTWAGLPLDVSHLELEVLACLAASPGVVWSHEELHEAAWGTRYVGDRDSVYSLVKRLRRKLTERGVALDLVAVRGVGFQLVPHPGSRAAPLDPPLLAHWQGDTEPA
jgi:DNA-binding response OmpR family regulator